MREVLITSSALILALLLLRRVFRQKISRRVQYALWGLVLIRLLLPVSLPALDFSVLTMAEPVRETISTRLEVPAFTAPVVPIPNTQNQPPQAAYPEAAEPVIPGTAPASPAAGRAEPSARELTVTEVLGAVWLTGTAAMTVWLVVSNLRFALKLRSRRITVTVPGCRYRVYMVESGLASPCLFGVLRPAVYLTPAAVRSEESLRHVLAHEETHARHMDPLWSLLRGVCLAVYWFDPLVWIAASAAKTDCELACDEGAVRRLGEGERLAYGRTLLSLIPVRRLPGNPLLSATTMSSDKKRLRDRLTRIAETRKTRKLALCAMALLTAGACLITFAGCSEDAAGNGPGAKPLSTAAKRQDGPISAAELRYFNEQYFNGTYMNIRNQFLSSIYETPADIDLFGLFYCGNGRNETMTDEEWAAFEAQGGFMDTDVTKLSTTGADAVLLEYTGLTLAETSKAGLENFTYLPDFDAYYHAHGDTNYRGQVNISAGVREGDLIHLYYDVSAIDSVCTCVTLREIEGGGYQFVSNTFKETPIIPTVYPSVEPVAAISLTDLTPFEPEKVEVTRRSGDCAERLISQGNWRLTSGEHIQAYRSTDGNIYVAQIIDGAVSNGEMVTWEADCFAVMPDEYFQITPFSDLFERSGFAVYYYGASPAVTDYYCFDTDGSLLHLAQVPGGNDGNRIIDLDGDGTNELLSTDWFSAAELLFQRDGRLYRADISALLPEALPEGAGHFEFSSIDPYARCLSGCSLGTAVKEDRTEFNAMLFRNIYFDGENLLFYKPDRTAVDHVSTGVIAPEVVTAAARDFAEPDGSHADIDDWRIVSLTGPWYESFDDLTVEIYRLYYEHHTTAPEDFMWAGGNYVDEDGWASPGYADCDYLYFRVEADSSRTYLFSMMDNSDGPGSEYFRESLEQALLDAGLLDLTPAQQVQAALDQIMENAYAVLQLRRPAGGKTDSKSIAASPNEGNAQNRKLGFTDPGSFSWTAMPNSAMPPAGDPAPEAEELMIASPNESLSLTFFSGSELVLCRDGDSRQWYRAECLCDPQDAYYDRSDIFNFMRQWFDESEGTGDQAAIPDDGRSRKEIAQAWAEAYEGAALDLTETNRYHCTYVDVRDVDTEEYSYIPREDYPESIGSREAFLIGYSVVFVPDDYRYHMAGNTGPYEGDDAPEGAYQYWRCAYLYLEDGYWRSDGPGTGP